MKRIHVPVLLLPALFAAALRLASGAETTSVRLPCVADTSVTSTAAERGANFGKKARLRLKGIESLALARFDTTPLAGRPVEKASLFLHAPGEHLLKTIGLSTVAVEWAEGEGNGTPATGGATFDWADFGKRRWGGRQSDLTDATFARQGTRHHYSPATPREGGWLEIAVPPGFVEALASGASHGLAISDEKGQTRWNNDVDAREQAGFAPYLLVTVGTGKAATVPPPGPPASPPPARPAPRPLQPVETMPWPGDEPPLHDGLRVWAYGEAEKAHPVTGNLLEETGEAGIAQAPAGEHRRRNPVWDGARSTVHLSAGANEFVAFHLCVEAAADPARAVRVTPTPFVGPGSARIPADRVRLFQDWYVRDGEWYPEVAVPLQGPFSIPDARNGVPGQRNQSVLVEVYVPHRTPPGSYSGGLAIAAEGVKAITVPVELRVQPFSLPDRLSFALDLNSYGPPGDAEMELRYQRMAHEHRATLSMLGYRQSGAVHPGYAPPLEGSGKAIRVRDWTEWDRRFGRYYDGSAFADLPRAGVPVRHAYLPFNEGWPGDIRKHYRFTPTAAEWAKVLIEHAMKAPPVEEAFDTQYQEEFRAVVREFARHFRERGWRETEFQFYLNNKYYYRDPARTGQGSAWWLLDEPMHRDDWLALRFYGRMFKESVQEVLGKPDAGDPKLLYREDVSRPQWQRDWLDGLVDLMCVSPEFFRKNELCMEMKRTQGVTFWHYGNSNDARVTNLTGEAWPLKVYLAGGDGMLPWSTVGGDAAFTEPTKTAILYPGARFGIAGPLASLRLKAMRRGQQDVEYLALLAKKRGWSREQLAAAVAPLLDLKAQTREQFVDDAGTTVFEKVSSEQFTRLRASVAAELATGR